METESKYLVVLGKRFDSENERREYFRNELRKKLPELKKMEGFPIGEDEDIINLLKSVNFRISKGELSITGLFCILAIVVDDFRARCESWSVHRNRIFVILARVFFILSGG